MQITNAHPHTQTIDYNDKYENFFAKEKWSNKGKIFYNVKSSCHSYDTKKKRNEYTL